MTAWGLAEKFSPSTLSRHLFEILRCFLVDNTRQGVDRGEIVLEDWQCLNSDMDIGITEDKFRAVRT